MNNLLVLSRESEAGASRVWNDGKIVEILLKVIDSNLGNEAVVVAAARVMDELAKNSSRVILSLCSLVFQKPFKFDCSTNFCTKKHFSGIKNVC